MNIIVFLFIGTFIIFPEYYFLVWYGMYALTKAVIKAIVDLMK